MKKYIIYMTGTSGEQYKFYAGQSTVNMTEQFMAENRKFLWMDNDEAINLNHIEHVKIHEIEEGERPR